MRTGGRKGGARRDYGRVHTADTNALSCLLTRRRSWRRVYKRRVGGPPPMARRRQEPLCPVVFLHRPLPWRHSRWPPPWSRVRAEGTGRRAAPLAIVQRPRARRVRGPPADGADRHRADWFRQRRDQSARISPRSCQRCRPVVRYPQFYGLNGRAVGIEHSSKYSLTRKSQTFEDQFFRFLARTGKPGKPDGLSDRLQRPGEEPGGRREVRSSTSTARPWNGGWRTTPIRGPMATPVLHQLVWPLRLQVPRLHANRRPDPDTGLTSDALQSNAIVPWWGGTRSRSWFYDFSAGPEWNTTNW